jgi:hypothetical protein
VSIRPLSQSDLAALLAHLHHDQDQDHLLRPAGPAPVVAVRVRASVGRPGASAHSQYRRRRATELATWARSLPWRVAAAVTAGVAAWLAAARIAPNLAAPAGIIVAAGLGWLLRFRSSSDTVAWRRGGAGERRTARLLAPSSGAAGRSCTTWPSHTPRPTLIAMIPSAAVAVRSDPNIDRPRCLQSGSVDRDCGRRLAPTSRANVT